MGKIFEQTINRFDGGMVNDGRDGSANSAQLIQHFDPLTRPHRLVPHIAPESGNSAQTTQGIRQMLYYNSKVFGTSISSVPPAIYERSDFTGDTWTASTNGADSSGTWNADVFVEYKGFAYGWRSNAAIWKADLSGSAAFVTSDLSVSGVGVQGLVHSKDDLLYMPYNVSGQGKIARKNADASWTSAAITLPTGMTLTSICEYGNYIAIACKPIYYGKSVVYLWDRDSSLTTLSDSIDFGVGDLEIIEVIDGYLIGISKYTSVSIYPKIVFRRYDGGQVKVYKELFASSAVSITLKGKQKLNNRLYFMLGITIAGTTYQGVWATGKSTSGDYTVYFSHDPVLSGGSVITSLTSFALFGDYMFIVYNDGADKMSKTNDSPSGASGYNISSIYESLIFNSGDSSKKKDLIGVTVFYDPLPTNGQVVLKYKTDADTSWTTIFTDATDNAISHSAINIESTGARITDFKEIRFRIESTGGAEITGFSYKTEETGKRLYE